MLRSLRSRMSHASRMLRERRARSVARRTLAQQPQPYKLNLGCGRVRLDTWVNIDSDPWVAPDIVWDLAWGLPAGEASCRLIYCEHLLEHLAVEDGLFLLKECRRALQAGGILRIAMPSLDVLIDKSSGGDWRNQDWLTWPEYRFIQTRAEMLNIAFRWWGHQWLYDREELRRRLREAGFSEIRDAAWGVSEDGELCRRESRKDSLLICEAHNLTRLR
jgi:predicted SAM-dependent methyltransferase